MPVGYHPVGSDVFEPGRCRLTPPIPFEMKKKFGSSTSGTTYAWGGVPLATSDFLSILVRISRGRTLRIETVDLFIASEEKAIADAAARYSG